MEGIEEELTCCFMSGAEAASLITDVKVNASRELGRLEKFLLVGIPRSRFVIFIGLFTSYFYILFHLRVTCQEDETNLSSL